MMVCRGRQQLIARLVGTARQVGTRLTSCSTEYVRGREAVMAGNSSFAFIANRNGSFILQGGERGRWRF